MAQKIFNKRTLAILLSLAMLLNGFQVSAMAAGNDTAPEMVQNFEDTYYKQDGTVTTANDWQVHLSKTAAVTDQENVFDITLKVETKDVSIQLNDGAAVLVLDVSSCSTLCWSASYLIRSSECSPVALNRLCFVSRSVFF